MNYKVYVHIIRIILGLIYAFYIDFIKEINLHTYSNKEGSNFFRNELKIAIVRMIISTSALIDEGRHSFEGRKRLFRIDYSFDKEPPAVFFRPNL